MKIEVFPKAPLTFCVHVTTDPLAAAVIFRALTELIQVANFVASAVSVDIPLIPKVVVAEVLEVSYVNVDCVPSVSFRNIFAP